jgi:3-hydroxyanthranilate 3,4-dioxygenase
VWHPDRQEPFFLVTALDEVLVQMAGRAEVRFQDGVTSSMCLEPGDTVYLPAGVPSRIVSIGECIQIRLKGQPPLQEAVAFYCRDCNSLLHAEEFTDAIPQRHYWRATSAFNADPTLRTCKRC